MEQMPSIDGKVWKIPEGPPCETVHDLRNRLIQLRKLEDELEPASLNQLHEPHLLKNADVAVQRILFAIESGERICIVGDYDVDGLCGTTILVETILGRWPQMREKMSWIIPDRFLDGYGLREELLERIEKTGANLVITIDNGSGATAAKAISSLKERGVDSIVLDHHLTHKHSEAIVVNPHQEGCDYPFKGLCGSAVTWKIACLLTSVEEALQTMDLLALATVADVMPLRRENRMFVQLGLEKMHEDPHRAIRSLCIARRQRWEAATSEMLAYWIAPILNASHRIPRKRTDANPAEQLLLRGDIGASNDLLRLFEKRRNLQDRAQTTIRQTIHHQRERSLIVLTGNDPEVFHEGLIGILAAEVVENTGKPCIGVTHSGKGSARSIEAYHITDALRRNEECLLSLGGHHHAAGFTVKKELFPLFRERMFRDAEEQLRGEEATGRLRPFLEVDAVVQQNQMLNIWNDQRDALKQVLAELGPFGRDNEAPRVLIPKLPITESTCIGSLDRHVRLETPVGRVTGYFFGRPNPSIEHVPHDVVLTPALGSEGVSLLLQSLRLPQPLYPPSSSLR